RLRPRDADRLLANLPALTLQDRLAIAEVRIALGQFRDALLVLQRPALVAELPGEADRMAVLALSAEMEIASFVPAKARGRGRGRKRKPKVEPTSPDRLLADCDQLLQRPLVDRDRKTLLE